LDDRDNVHRVNGFTEPASSAASCNRQPTRGRIEVLDPVRFPGKGCENGEEGSQEESHEQESRKEEEEEVMSRALLLTARGQ
jgi:hypothetical protein